MKLMFIICAFVLSACTSQPQFDSKKFQESFNYCYQNVHHSYMRRDALPTVGECRIYALAQMNK